MTKTLYAQKNYPILQNRVYNNVHEAKNCITSDIEIVENLSTGLIYNSIFNSALIVYDDNYNNEQSLSPVFQSHLNKISDIIENQFGKQRLIEVGCGKGFFLESLLKRGCDIVGFDPSYEGQNPRIEKKYFDHGVIQKLAKGLILRHVLEHIPNPVDFLFKLKQANGNQGLVYIEVPCFEWICDKRAFFDIYYEHVNYFRLIDFFNMFDNVVKAGHCFGGQYLYVIADLATLKYPKYKVSSAIDFPVNFTTGLQTIMDDIKSHSAPICVWGAASKGVIFSMFCQRFARLIDVAVDVNPAKHGQYLPVTGVEIVSPKYFIQNWPKESRIYVMNSNYLEEIKQISYNKYTYITIDQ